ncbi:hypothetical protein THTE_2285 [Thermogutta terrifontis]|uniref:Uncharacterized protein n=1 Tax=Thermogutta terrifontis TaxID=1331910 RepID=A0A286RG03_9BACT|nr:hypothetical protein THTE_2285 [Thermogutta terrifontis]
MNELEPNPNHDWILHATLDACAERSPSLAREIDPSPKIGKTGR